jgi:SpoVK/Ycf46/Vps4 family AAA+-type ATPase
VPLIATSYGEWQSSGDGHLGDVTKAITAAFKRARAAVPCILFIDELDSVQSRGGATRHDDWWTAIINCLLAELDGVEGREGVVVVGASNFAERVDAAIRRSGRLDREIRIRLPDAEALALILRGYLGEDLAGEDLHPVAIRAIGGTGADCERWVRGARRRARHAGRPMAAEDLLAEIRGEPDSRRTVEFGTRVAVHEAGHVIAYYLL